MIVLMQTFSEVEEHIAAARRFYNSAVNELNNAVQIFPSCIVASLINIKSFAFFKADDFEKININVSEHLK
jgi:LemA protein